MRERLRAVSLRMPGAVACWSATLPERSIHSLDKPYPRAAFVFREVCGIVLARPAKVGLGESVLGEVAYLSGEDVGNRSMGMLGGHFRDIPTKLGLGHGNEGVAKEIFDLGFGYWTGANISGAENIPVPESVNQRLLFSSLVPGVVGIQQSGHLEIVGMKNGGQVHNLASGVRGEQSDLIVEVG